MKNVIFAIILVVVATASFFLGGLSVVNHADGWIDNERNEFVVDWAGQYWSWDISEE